ncbi:MAG: hypothetical protein ACI81W_002059, partial [Saprospiraceae bacterium]
GQKTMRSKSYNVKKLGSSFPRFDNLNHDISAF